MHVQLVSNMFFPFAASPVTFACVAVIEGVEHFLSLLKYMVLLYKYIP